MNCTWEEFEEKDERGWRRVRCSRCKHTTAPTPNSHDTNFRDCDSPGLGDYVKYGLAFFGITPERVARLRGKKGCGGCPEKQAALNELGKKIGL